MSSDFDVRRDLDATDRQQGARRLVPMRVGAATVYVEATGDAPALPPGEAFHAVGLDPQEAFATASEALKECVRVMGERLESMRDGMRPQEVGVEFTITFDVEGQARIIPVLLTGKAKTAVGIKVSARWQPGQ